MKRLFNLSLLIILLSLASVVRAQDKFLVRGMVKDATGEPLYGVTVVETSEDDRFLNGSITDFNGNFQIEVESGSAMLKISYIGFKTQTIMVQNRSTINVTLESDVLLIAETTIVAERQNDNSNLTPIAQRNDPGSTVTIDISEMEGGAATSVDEMMQGQIAGMDVVMSSGDPGAGSNIVIRGLGSLSNSNPLFVVDGIAQDLKAGDDFDYGSADVQDIGDLVSIPPQDIKSVTVLKDASSTAIWGSRGANGVILIETHKGTKGKTQFEYSYKFTYDAQAKNIPLLNGDEYVTLMLEERFNPSLVSLDPDLLSGLGLVVGDADYYNYHQNTDWVDAITKAGFSNEHNFKVSGGGDKTQYYASVNYKNQDGTTLNTGFKRFSNRINLDYKLSKKIKIVTNFVFSNSSKGENPSVENPGNTRQTRNIRQMAAVKAPNMGIYERDVFGNLTGEYFNPINSYQGNGVWNYNPVSMANLSRLDIEDNNIEANFRIRYNVAPKLNADGLISYQYSSTKSHLFAPSNAFGANWLNTYNNQSQEGDEDRRQLTGQLKLNYGNTFGSNGEHSFNATGMYEIRQKNGAVSQLASSLSASDLLTDVSSPGFVDSKDSKSNTNETRAMGALLNLHYKYLDKYIFQLNARMDASTKFGRDQRYALFPSASVAWRLGKESFLGGLNWLMEDSKLRASYGFSGNDNIGAYDRHALYGNASGFPSTYIYSDYNVIVPKQVQLDNVRWETKTMWNLGADIYLFRGRFDFVTEVYGNITSDLLWDDYKIPSSSGYGILKAFNGGEISNRGWEFQANFYPIKNDNHVFKINVNASRNRNRFNALPPNLAKVQNTTIQNEKYVQRIVLGQPVGSFYGFNYLGVYPTDQDAYARDASGNVIYDLNNNPLYMSFNQGTNFYEGGDAKYRDVNYDGSIDILDVVYLGDSNPDFTGGFGFNYNMKKYGIVISASFHSRVGFDIVNGIASETQGMTGTANQSTAVLRRWRRPGMDFDNLLPRAYMNHKSNNLGSDRYVEDGSFLRFNNLSITYKVNKDFVNKLHLRSLNISANARKLYTWTNYTGQDPEVSQTGKKGDIFWIGSDESKTPPPRSFNFALTVGF